MFNVESSGEKNCDKLPISLRVLEFKTKDMTIIIKGKGGEFKHLRARTITFWYITVVDQSSVSQLKVPLHRDIVEMYCMSQC